MPAASYENPLPRALGPAFFDGVPQTPGVYFMLDDADAILYIGKAKNLKVRLLSYRRARPGTAADYTLELLESVRAIRWKECRSEKKALALESDLLHTVRPPFNIANTEAENYLFIGLRVLGRTRPGVAGRKLARVDFRLCGEEVGEGYALFGCFKYPRKTKDGYIALLRVMYAASFGRSRLRFPARLGGRTPPYLYTLWLPEEWIPELRTFLRGRSRSFLRRLVAELLSNEAIPRFMYPSIQDDIEVVRDFFRKGLGATRRLKAAHGVRSPLLPLRRMDELLAEKSLRELLDGSRSLATGTKLER